MTRPSVSLRPPATVMRLARLGASHQTRLSFMRVLLRGLKRGGWQADRPVWDIDAAGVGHAVYRVRGQGQVYCLVAFSHDLPAEQRSDRVIAEAWDATFALVDGEVSDQDIARLAANVPLQEAGRVSDRELVLSRANRSVRLWDHVVERLAQGEQPDTEMVADVGYLMRTTAVYGSGKFGAADHAALSGRAVVDGPFRAEMLAVWLIRAFVMDLVEHMAQARGGVGAARLHPDLRRGFGIGNSTGLGMAPFLVNHPGLLNAWITARETALVRVRLLEAATGMARTRLLDAVSRSRALVDSWHSDHPTHAVRVTALAKDLELLGLHLAGDALDRAYPWDALWRWGEGALSVEGQEMLLSLMLEPHGALVDDLADAMGANELAQFPIAGAMTTDELRDLVEAGYDWALGADYEADRDCARFWYVSEAKLEPRLGQRHEEPGAMLEQPLDVGRAVAALHRDLSKARGTVASFLIEHPQHRLVVRRAQLTVYAPFAEIRDNLIAADVMPIDMLRCKLAFFGATRFDPRSDRWVRITMFQGAPFPDELNGMTEDDWVLPGRAA